MVTGLSERMMRVWPSGALRIKSSMPIAALAPGLFSTMTLWPTPSCRFFAMTRAVRSMLPPGA